MGKYVDMILTRAELIEIARVAETLQRLDSENISIDHVQLGDSNGDIIGKLQYLDGIWAFQARRHDKPGVLGE